MSDPLLPPWVAALIVLACTAASVELVRRVHYWETNHPLGTRSLVIVTAWMLLVFTITAFAVIPR